MLNVFKQTKPWMIASLLAASSVFAQDMNNKNNCRTPKAPDPMPAPMTAAYNAPARIDVRGSWDLYLGASFIYWQPLQDNMEFAVSSSSTTAGDSLSGTTAAPISNNIVNLSTNYKPGFQVMGGMNFDYDNWDSSVMYTWFHNTNSSSTNGPTGGTVWPIIGHPQAAASSFSSFYNSASSSWNLKMDIADWVLARSYYVGTKLTCRPYFGARAAWIRQKYNQTYTRTTATASTATVQNKSTSWGIGPEAGMTANYMFSYGLRAFGDFSGDLLYTRYGTSFHQTNTVATYDLKFREKGISTVRAHTMLDLGLGWGSYFDNNNWHFDLMASYGFQIFWNQNMFRHFVDDVMDANSNIQNGDLYVHGLNITVRFDF